MSKSYDLIVIGSGPGGYVAAIRAAQLGLKTAIVEKEHLGGICLNWGCIPTKALLRSAEVLELARNGEAFGLKIEKAEPDLKAIVERSRKVADQLSSGVKFLLKKNKVDVISGFGKLIKAQKGHGIMVTPDNGDAETYTAQHVIIATGARPREIPAAGLVSDGKNIVTYKEAMVPESLPEKLLVIGSGAIGVEFASFYHALGSNVTIAEMMPRILPVEDHDVSAAAAKAFKKQGFNLLTETKIENLKASANKVKADITDKSGKKTTETFDKVILAIGIAPNTEGIGLENLGVTMEKGHILIDEWAQTNVKGIYAIGDVAGAPWLAHKASHEGIACVEKIAGFRGAHPIMNDNIPGCTYCHPQIASLGLTEEEAKKTGRKLKIGQFPLIGNGKAIALGDSDGFIKTIFDDATGELLGAHMIGPDVTELIQGLAIARQGELTEAELMQTVFPHPTLSEAIHESVLAAYGRPIHI